MRNPTEERPATRNVQSEVSEAQILFDDHRTARDQKNLISRSFDMTAEYRVLVLCYGADERV